MQENSYLERKKIRYVISRTLYNKMPQLDLTNIWLLIFYSISFFLAGSYRIFRDTKPLALCREEIISRLESARMLANRKTFLGTYKSCWQSKSTQLQFLDGQLETSRPLLGVSGLTLPIRSIRLWNLGYMRQISMASSPIPSRIDITKAENTQSSNYREGTQLVSYVTLREHLLNYPTPLNFTYIWSFGSIAGLFLVIQILSGLFLSFHYTPHINYAFSSVEHIIRDVSYGSTLRYIHANGASSFFMALYIHIAKALYYNSFTHPFGNVWRIGVMIFIVSMATAFLGYVLPWGQMSFWGATVITNLFTAIPLIGEILAIWLWGGYAVENATLNRFFGLHFLLPFLIAGLVILHLTLLHIPGSSNPLKKNESCDYIPFYPYFFLKDLFSIIIISLPFVVFTFMLPDVLGHSDNYIEANPLSTPSHIVPEWYFLPFYAILRSIPNKIGGVMYMAGAIMILIYLPGMSNLEIKKGFFLNAIAPEYRPITQICYWTFIANVLILGWVGGKPVEEPYIIIGQLATSYYFVYLAIIVKILPRIESFLLTQGRLHSCKRKNVH